MNKLLAGTAIVFGLVLTQQAFARDWGKQASSTPVVVADCGGGQCYVDQLDIAPTPQTPQDCTNSGCNRPKSPAPQQAKAATAPTIVADCQGGC